MNFGTSFPWLGFTVAGKYFTSFADAELTLNLPRGFIGRVLAHARRNHLERFTPSCDDPWFSLPGGDEVHFTWNEKHRLVLLARPLSRPDPIALFESRMSRFKEVHSPLAPPPSQTDNWSGRL
jgi:hypothetical protein